MTAKSLITPGTPSSLIIYGFCRVKYADGSQLLEEHSGKSAIHPWRWAKHGGRVLGFIINSFRSQRLVFLALLVAFLILDPGGYWLKLLPESQVFRSIPAVFASTVLPSAVINMLPDKVPCAVRDRQEFEIPDVSHFTGWIGSRLDANERNRLLAIDPARLLEGYRKRPGRQAWDGEHVGKWLHAATLAWVYSGDAELRKKLDYVADELCKCQLADGYLGTYTADQRWTEWDVWAHKYNLLGLMTYMRYTGNLAPMPTCRRMADLLCNTFGDQPGKRDIITSGWHTGMASTSVLEPMVLFYRMTGEPRYLDFCKYILRAWEQPNGPHIVSRLLDLKRVDKVGNAKAYEMLSCLNGALELYRTTGDDRLLSACLNAWQDIVDKRLYLTGAASHNELFCEDFNLPNTGNVGETCVTVTWLQLNAQLLRLTGEARFADQLEHVVLNQLFGAQRPDGTGWGYYVEMEGKKPYRDSLDGHCCLSSGPRGLALVPTFAVTTDPDGVVVNMYDAGTSRLMLADKTPVTVTTSTLYPSEGNISMILEPAEGQSREFMVKLRVPSWCRESAVTVNGKEHSVSNSDGYACIKRPWKGGDQLNLSLKLEPRLTVGDHLNAGKVAVSYGPLVLSADEALLDGRDLNTISIAKPDLPSLDVKPEPAYGSFKTWPGARLFSVKIGADKHLKLIPFADAGATGSAYRVWLPTARQ